jgi:hypothetical protein
MTATTTSTVLVPVQPLFTDAERLALAGFLTGYRGQTRDAYALDLRQFTTWCRARSLPLSAVRRAGIELFVRVPRSGTIILELPSAEEAELTGHTVPGSRLDGMDTGVEPAAQYPLVVGIPADDDVVKAVQRLS